MIDYVKKEGEESMRIKYEVTYEYFIYIKLYSFICSIIILLNLYIFFLSGVYCYMFIKYFPNMVVCVTAGILGVH